MKKLEVENQIEKHQEWVKKESEERGLEYTSPKMVAVGYLDITEDYQKGPVSQNFINNLKMAYDDGPILMTLGHHTCEFCGKFHGTGEKYLIDKRNNIAYQFPEMIFHYIEEHDYQPPEEFVLFILMMQSFGGSTTLLEEVTKNEN